MDINSLTIMAVNKDVFTDNAGDISPTPFWTSDHKPGKYETVVDTNQNGIFDEGIDTIDNNDIEITGGFFAIQVYWLGIIIGLLIMVVGFAVFYIRKRRH